MADSLDSFISPRTHGGELGRWLISAFVEAGTGRRLLLNRGWIPASSSPPPIEGQLQVEGRVRGSSGRNTWTPENKPSTGAFFSIDVPQLAKKLHTEPFLLDVTTNLNSGPIPIPPPVPNLPDNHLEYIGTWYTLSAALTVLALRYGKKQKKS